VGPGRLHRGVFGDAAGEQPDTRGYEVEVKGIAGEAAGGPLEDSRRVRTGMLVEESNRPFVPRKVNFSIEYPFFIQAGITKWEM